MKKSLFIQTAVALALAAPLLASAESNLALGGADAAADLNFRVVIPGFIALKIGTGAILTNTNTTDRVEFALSDPQVTVDGAVAPTSGGTVSVALLSNVGTVDFASTGADLTDGTETIPLSSISVANTTGTLAHPTFNAAATPVATNVGSKVINRSGTWTFSYNHQGATTPVGAGTYDTTVTYTAALP